MRTINVEMDSVTPVKIGRETYESHMRTSTEVIVGEDDDIFDKGREASKVLCEFMKGFGSYEWE